MKKIELLVIGGGPAGMQTAIEASKYGVSVMLIDKYDKLGGQLFKQIHRFFGSKRHYAGYRGYEISEKLAHEIEKQNIDVSLNTIAYWIYNKEIGVEINHRYTNLIKAKKIVLATGAYENPLAFQGWTLPGVMSAGAAQTMVNFYRVSVGKKVLVVGSGNVGLISAYSLLQSGANVTAILEAQTHIGGYHVHAYKLRRVGIPIYTSYTIKEAIGKDRVEKTIIHKLDENLLPIPGTEKELEVDTICIAIGLSPLAKLAWMAGCRFKYIPSLGGYIPLHNEYMETTLPGIYIAGDISGIEEASTAMEEGKLTGLSVAKSLGYISHQEAENEREVIEASLLSLRSNNFSKFKKNSLKMMSGDGSGLKICGIPSEEELDSCPGIPKLNKIKNKRVAIIECFEKIPCNLCEDICPTNAIKIGEPITNLPYIDPEKCIGCGFCVPKCPGLVIFLLDTSHPQFDILSLPYEFLPLPNVGDEVLATNRSGKEVSEAKVVEVSDYPLNDGTKIITIKVPKGLGMTVRSFLKKGV